MAVEAEDLAVILWRVVGATMIIYGFLTAIVQFLVVNATFGEIMNVDALYEGESMIAMLIWPIALILAGLIVVFASRALGRSVVRGLNKFSSSQ